MIVLLLHELHKYKGASICPESRLEFFSMLYYNKHMLHQCVLREQTLLYVKVQQLKFAEAISLKWKFQSKDKKE